MTDAYAQARAVEREAFARLSAACEAVDAARTAWNAAQSAAIAARKADPSPYTDDELTYSASARCKCGSGLAYPANLNAGEWDCSAVLKGEAPATEEHATFPFAFYSIKGERQPSAQGATTRPNASAENL